MEGEMFVYGSVSVITEASKVFLTVLQYLAERARFELEMSSYSDKYAEVLGNPDQYAVFAVTGDLQDADELKSMMVKAGMDPDKIIQFDENNQFLCVRKDDRELFLTWLEQVQQMDPLSFEIDENAYEPENTLETAGAEYLPRVMGRDPKYVVDQKGDFRAITDNEGHMIPDGEAAVIRRYDSYGRTAGSYQESDNSPRYNANIRFINGHAGVYCQTPNGNMIDEKDIHPDGTYDAQDVILLRDSHGTMHFENGAAEPGMQTAKTLKGIKNLSFKTRPGGFVSRKAPDVFIPAIDPETGDYYDFPSERVILSPYTLPPETDPEYENICASRCEAVMKRAYDLADHTEPFYLDKDGNMTTRNPHDKDKTVANAVKAVKGKVKDIYYERQLSDGEKLGEKPEAEPFVVILADEYGVYRKDGKEIYGFEIQQENAFREAERERSDVQEEAEQNTEDQQEEELQEEEKEGSEEPEEASDSEEEKKEKKKQKQAKHKDYGAERADDVTEQTAPQSSEAAEEIPVSEEMNEPETAIPEAETLAADAASAGSEPAEESSAKDADSARAEEFMSQEGSAGAAEQSHEPADESSQYKEETPSEDTDNTRIEESRKQEENARTAEHNQESAAAAEASRILGGSAEEYKQTEGLSHADSSMQGQTVPAAETGSGYRASEPAKQEYSPADSGYPASEPSYSSPAPSHFSPVSSSVPGSAGRTEHNDVFDSQSREAPSHTENPANDYAAAIRNARPAAPFEPVSGGYVERSHPSAGQSSRPVLDRPAGTPVMPVPPVMNTPVAKESVRTALFPGQSIGGAQRQVQQGGVNTTRSKDLAAMRSSGSAASSISAEGRPTIGRSATGSHAAGSPAVSRSSGTRPAVGHDTRIKTNFLTQRKIFGAEEIQIAGSSQRRGLGQAVDTTRLGQNVWHMYTSMGREASGQDNATRQAQSAMRAAAVAGQISRLRDGMTANTLRNTSMRTMAAAYQNGMLTGMNTYMKRNGLQAFDKSVFVGGKAQINAAFDQRMTGLYRSMQRDGLLKRNQAGFYKLVNPEAAATRMFGPKPTDSQIKMLKQLVENQQAHTSFVRSGLNAKRMLTQTFVSMAAHQDPAAAGLHQGYHMIQSGVRTYDLLRKAFVSDMKFTYGMFGMRGKFDRHQNMYRKAKKKLLSDGNMSTQEFKKSVQTFQKKTRAELRHMNKQEVQRYKHLREARKQQDWINANRSRLHASQAKDAKIAELKKNVKDFNDLPKNYIKKQGRQLVNWAGQAAPGTAVRNAARKVSSSAAKMASRFQQTRVGRIGTKIGSVTKKFVGKANRLGAEIRKRLMKALNAIKALLIKFLLAYVGTVVFLGLFVLFIMMPISTNLSMFIDDQKAMVDEASSAASISGKVYSELRYMEIQWASDIRSYGTQKNPIQINNTSDQSLLYTDRKLTTEEYLNSEEGIKDLLGAFAYEDGKKDNSHSGIQGPAPFAGAKLDDYKVIKQVDGGNVLELEGKPQEGWTSNSKEIIAMSTVFYSQCIEEVTTDTQDAVASWQSFWDAAETLYHRVGTYFEATDFPILGWIAGGTDWSYTGLYRNYAYPLALNSHLENYYLSTYIYPTKWTAPELANEESGDTGDDSDAANNAESATHEKSADHMDARYDSNQEQKTAEPGDVLLNKQWGISRNTEAKHGKLGIGKDGGTGKVDSKNQVSKGLWGSLGDDNYQGFETCEDAIGNAADRNIYNGYGCMLRYRFSYKWNGSFGTDEDGNVLDEAAVKSSGINTLHYGEADPWNEPNEGDGEGTDENNNNVEYNKTGGDVSADVSPYYQNEDVARGYQKDSCLVYPLKLSDIAWSCWEETGTTEINMTEGGGYHPEWKLWQKQFDNRNRQRHFTHDDSDWAIDKIVTTGEGFDVYSFRIPRDEDGNILFDEATDATIFHIRHNCTGKHQGVYCGGHAQLRTRGIIYGLSKEQVTDQVLGDDEHSLYDPKFLDPDSNGKDEEWYGSALTVRNEPVSEFNAASLPDTDGSKILEEDAEYVKDARDLYDIDVLITRPKDMYPQTAERSDRKVIKRAANAYLALSPFGAAGAAAVEIWDKISDAPKASQPSDTTTNTEWWKSWTLTNMSQVTEMINQNWHDMYQVVDTQTIVGGQDGSNSLDDDMMNNVLDQLGWNDVANSIDYGNPQDIANLVKERNGENAVVNGKELSITEEMEYVNRLRHLKYALSLVGKASYSQDEHDKLWGNLSGHMTDCSGYVSNVWRDALGLTGGYGAMATSGLAAYAGSALHEYTGPDTAGIEPGDIILKNPDDIGGSAHALIYVGKLDSSRLYLNRSATNEDGTAYQFYNDDGSLKYSGEGETQVYAVDCSTMTITTDTYAENSPNTLKQFLTDPSWDTFKGLVHQNNKEPDGGVQKARSGNIRFSAKSYLNDNSAGYDLYYIDMNQLAKNKGIYSSGDDGTLSCIYGTFWDDYANYQSADRASGTTPQNKNSYEGQYAEAADNFWEKDTTLGTELNRRQTVAISSSVGEEEKKAADWEITDPPVPEEPNVDDPQEYDDFDWRDYADKLPDGEFKEQLQALIDYYGDSQWAKYYSSGLIKIRKTSDGKLVFYEEQAAKWNGKLIGYGTAVAGSDPTNTVARRGCFLYALAAAMTAKTGKIYTVQETIEECGGTLKWNSDGTLRMSGLGTVGGSVDKLNANAQNTGLSGSYSAKSNISLSKIDEGLKEGKVYCVWSTSASDPKGTLHSPNGAGMHWTAIIGRTSSGNYIVACNGDRGMEISPSQMPKYFESCAEIS